MISNEYFFPCSNPELLLSPSSFFPRADYANKSEEPCMDTACKAGGDKNDTSGRALIIGPEKDFGQTTSVIERETGFQEDRLDLISDSSYKKTRARQ